jgi:hypothetical protein
MTMTVMGANMRPVRAICVVDFWHTRRSEVCLQPASWGISALIRVGKHCGGIAGSGASIATGADIAMNARHPESKMMSAWSLAVLIAAAGAA